MTWLSRREMLATLLGAPVAAACDPREWQEKPRVLPPGEIVFPIERRGHAVRDGVHTTTVSWTSPKVVIIGGGVAGLSAAWRLVRAGFTDFTLLEMDDITGGTAKSGANEVSAYPWGAHYITVPMKENRALLKLLGELGLLTGTDDKGEPVVDEAFLCRDPQERLFYRGSWSPGLYLHAGATENDHAELARFRARMDGFASQRDGRGRRAFTLPIAHASDDPAFTELDRLSMADWMAREGFTSTRLLWTIDYACRDDYGSPPSQTSAWAGIFYFAARIASPGADGQPVITWPEGNGRLVHHLAEAVLAQVRVAAAAYDVIPATDGSASVDVLALCPEGPVGFHAEQAIVATPQLVTRRIVRPFRDERPGHLDAFTYGAWLVANLTVRERPRGRGFPFAWDNVLYESASLGYVVAGHQSGRDHGPTVLTYYHPLADEDPNRARQRLLSATRDEWADACLADLSVAHPNIAESTTRLDVMRWGHAMIRPLPGFLWGTSRREAARPIRGIHFAHSDLSGVALFEEAFDHGVRAAEEVLAARGLAFEPLR
jgi:glycine/D-amino acid oxidase-like deaminating enzyme